MSKQVRLFLNENKALKKNKKQKIGRSYNRGRGARGGDGTHNHPINLKKQTKKIGGGEHLGGLVYYYQSIYLEYELFVNSDVQFHSSRLFY